MKKIMTLCFFAFAMLMGTQTMNAQSMVEINSLASKKTQELKKAVKFNNDTQDLVYQAYQGYEKKMASVKKIEAGGKTVSAEDIKVIDKALTTKFKTIFTEEEFQRYLIFEEKK